MSSFNPFGPGNNPGQSPSPGQVPGGPAVPGPGYPGGFGNPAPRHDESAPGPHWTPNAAPGPVPGRHEAPRPANPYGPSGPYTSAEPYGSAGFEHNDPLARPQTATLPVGGPAITLAGPPNGILVAAAVCAVIGGVVGAIGWGRWWSLLGWVLAGPVAIWLVARFVAVDTERKTATVYARPGSTGLLWVVALVAVVVAIAVTALAVGFWVGQL